MLKKLILENWKSFRYAELPIDPLTVLIGTNASGKSNAIEALEFLKRIASGKQIQDSLTGNLFYPAIRGGIDWITLRSQTSFTLSLLTQGEADDIDYLYTITVGVHPEIQLLSESLTRIESNSEPKKNTIEIFFFQTEDSDRSDLKDDMESEFAIFARFSIDESRSYSVAIDQTATSSQTFLGILSGMIGRKHKFYEGVRSFLRAIQNIFILDPLPSKMRSYSPLSNELLSDASNIAGVLAALPDEEKVYIEMTLSTYISHLPEKDIRKVWAEPVGRLNSDAMLYCEESWSSDEPAMVIDARGMSDGTLRFLAIVTALLTQPEGSQLVIEEVDNGLHPSRSELLLKMLKELGAKRKIDILVTTHNPALLNALEPEMIPFVVVAHRDSQTGESKLTPLDDIQRLPKLLASGHIGDLATQGAIEKSLSQ